MWTWKLTVDPLFVDCQSNLPPGPTEVITFSCESESWLLILSLSIIDLPLPQINRGDHLFTWKWRLTWSSFCHLLIHPQDQQRWLPFHMKVKVDYWSSLLIVDPPPARINRGNCLFTWKWKLTVDPLSIIDSPRINSGNCLFTWELTVDPLCWSLICPPQDHQRQLPFHMQRLLILSVSIVNSNVNSFNTNMQEK